MLNLSCIDPVQCAMDAQSYRRWLDAHGAESDRSHVRRAMALALQRELTATQRAYAVEYYLRGRTMAQIGAAHGVGASTVSRTLSRARARLRRVLQYSSPRFMPEEDHK